MKKIIFNLFLIMELSSCQRRITNGTSVDDAADTSFLVYIVAASTEDTDPGWLCGGSIIHPSLVLTSAACLRVGTQRMYVVAGYRIYVRTEHLENDACTKHMKKRIISYCTHFNYAHDDENERVSSSEHKHRWTKFDIAIARTDSPIDFFDNMYTKYCSYLPNSIRTNYNSRYEKADSDVVIYGWGHAVYYRPDGDIKNYNERHLKYATSVIIRKEDCMALFKSKYLKYRIKTNLMCADGKGNFDARGRYLITIPPTKNICSRRNGNDSYLSSETRRRCFEDSFYNKTSTNDTLNSHIQGPTRRNGICQNDHGGPLVRWIGGHPYVIGVATAFRVNKQMMCVGPYLYSSVRCTSRFVNCILEEQKKHRRTFSNCNEPDKGYKSEETHVNWSRTVVAPYEEITYEDLDLL